MRPQNGPHQNSYKRRKWRGTRKTHGPAYDIRFINCTFVLIIVESHVVSGVCTAGFALGGGIVEAGAVGKAAVDVVFTRLQGVGLTTLERRKTCIINKILWHQWEVVLWCPDPNYSWKQTLRRCLWTYQNTCYRDDYFRSKYEFINNTVKKGTLQYTYISQHHRGI